MFAGLGLDMAKMGLSTRIYFIFVIIPFKFVKIMYFRVLLFWLIRSLFNCVMWLKMLLLQLTFQVKSLLKNMSCDLNMEQALIIQPFIYDRQQ